MTLTSASIAERVAELRALEGKDREAACAGAEALRIQVLEAISNGARNPSTLAKAAMVTIVEDIGGDYFRRG